MLGYLNVEQRRFGDDDRRGHDDGVRIVRDDRGGRRRLVLFLLQAESQPRAGADVRAASKSRSDHRAPAADSFVWDGGARDNARDNTHESAGEKGEISKKIAEEEKVITEVSR